MLAKNMSMWLERLTTSIARTATVAQVRNIWFIMLPGSHSSHGIRPQAALITACIATMRENQGWVRSYSLLSEVSY